MFLNQSSEETVCAGTVTVREGVSGVMAGGVTGQSKTYLLGSRGDSESRSLGDAARKTDRDHLVTERDSCASPSSQESQ